MARKATNVGAKRDQPESIEADSLVCADTASELLANIEDALLRHDRLSGRRAAPWRDECPYDVRLTSALAVCGASGSTRGTQIRMLDLMEGELNGWVLLHLHDRVIM